MMNGVKTGARGRSTEGADAIAAGYACTGSALDLGALLRDGRCLPEARVRLPLSVLSRHGPVAGATGTGRPRRSS
ncbi:hypothetical protein AQJ58_29355 [Streptomyces sp. DSM 15324]|nr:hypothetical protein AQJ58_29355 [Streptomyces sp. DSM 15324]